MKVWSWRQAVQKSGLPAMTKLVLFNLANYMNEVGQGCYPTTRQQAVDCTLSERSVCTHLEAAQQAGFIIKKTHGVNGQGWARNEYHASMPEGTEIGSAPKSKRTEADSAPYEAEVLNDVQHVEEEALNVAQEGTERDDTKALNHVQSNSPVNSPMELSSSTPIPPDPEILFERFWEAYPDIGKDGARGAAFKGARKKALESFQKTLTGKNHENHLGNLLNACTAYRGHLERSGYPAKHASTWLNNECWKDDYSSSTGSPKTHNSGSQGYSIQNVLGQALADRTNRHDGREERLEALGIMPD